MQWKGLCAAAHRAEVGETIAGRTGLLDTGRVSRDGKRVKVAFGNDIFRPERPGKSSTGGEVDDDGIPLKS